MFINCQNQIVLFRTYNTAHERLATSRYRSHLRIFFPSFSPSSYGQHSDEVWILVFERYKFFVASLFYVSLKAQIVNDCCEVIYTILTELLNIKMKTNLGIENQHTPSHVTDSTERIDNVSAHFTGDIIDIVRAIARTINGPITKVANSFCQTIRLVYTRINSHI